MGDFVGIMGKLLRRENSHPFRLAKMFCWKCIVGKFRGDVVFLKELLQTRFRSIRLRPPETRCSRVLLQVARPAPGRSSRGLSRHPPDRGRDRGRRRGGDGGFGDVDGVKDVGRDDGRTGGRGLVKLTGKGGAGEKELLALARDVDRHSLKQEK